jgi:hypothetical protein
MLRVDRPVTKYVTVSYGRISPPSERPFQKEGAAIRVMDLRREIQIKPLMVLIYFRA